jgi:ABC-type multidrug transport system fused ATPase/permease subunit
VILFKLYKRLLPYIKPYRGRMLFATLLNVISSLLSVVVVMAIIPMVQTVLTPVPKGGATSMLPSLPANKFIDQQSILEMFRSYFIQGTRADSLFRICAFIFVAFALKNIFGYFSGYVMTVVEGGMVKDLRDKVFTRLSTLSIDFFYERKQGLLLSRVTNDVNNVNSTLVSGIMTAVGQPIQLGLYLFVLFNINLRLSLISFGIAIGSMILINFFGKTIKRISHRVQQNQGDVLAIAQEMIGGVKVVKSFGMEHYEVKRFREETRLGYQASRRLARIRQFIGPINETLAVAGFVGILYFGGHEVFAGSMDGGELFLFLIALIQLMQPVRSLSELNGRLHEGSAAAENLFSILDATPTVVDGTVIERVEFKYSTAIDPAINGIDLEIRPNEVLALVGPSGGGKTTFVDLLVRFYDPSKGRIVLEGRDLRDYDLNSLRKLFGIVTQDTVLFHDTIGNNIAYGNKNASQSMIEEAAQAANAHSFILDLPQGYKTMAGDRGVRMSGGQRQRIAIARALLKNPPILIFDEATSALDTENEMLVQEAIERLLKQRTAVVIAHRLSTIQQADRIAVINAGRVVELGSHV